MKISVIMVDGGFRQRIFAAESFAEQNFPSCDYEILWVEYYERAHPRVRRHPRVRVIELGKTGLYHSSCCFNRGIKEAAGRILVIPDADVLVEKDFLSRVYREHHANHELAMYFFRLCQEKDGGFEEEISLEWIRDRVRLLPNGVENYGGCLSVRKNWLLRLGGYEQHRAFASGNHANGRDVYTRLKNLGLCIKWHPSLFLYHPWHSGTGGEGADKKRVRWQHEIVKYKAVNRMTTAFQGLEGPCHPRFQVPSPPLGDPDEGRRTSRNLTGRRGPGKEAPSSR